MPITHLLLMLLAVLIAAALTLWLITLGGPALMLFALPAFLIAALAIKALRR